MNLADALVTKTYENGERIIKQGKIESGFWKKNKVDD